MICKYQSTLQRKVNIHKKSQQIDYIDFEFPFSIFKTKEFKEPNDINQDLIRQGIKLYFYRGRVFDRDDQRTRTHIKIIFKCKNHECTAKLVYVKKLTQEFFEPIIFINLHNHKKLKDSEKAKRQYITNFILQLRGKQYEQFRKIPKWVQKFDINNQEGLYIVQQVYWCNNTEEQILTALSYRNITIRRLVEGDQTLLIFLRTQKMKENYLKYGETLTVELYYEKQRKRPIHQNYAIGYFIGQDYNMRIVLLGIFVITQQSTAVWKKLFNIYFDTTCQQIMPNCIVTDYREDLKIALSQIKKQRNYKFFHLHPWYHMIERFKQKLKPYQNGKIIMDLMCRSMQQINQNNFFELMCILKTQTKIQSHLFDYFVENRQFYCLKRIPKKFSGFVISTKFGEKVLGQVNNSAVYRAHTGRLFHRLLTIQKHLQTAAQKVGRINVALIKYCPIQINQLYDKLQTNIMQIIVQIYLQSKQYRKQIQNEITINIYDKQQKKYKCKFSLQYDHWQCQCEQIFITGIPCCHLMYILMDQKIKGSILYYLNSRWISQKKDKQFAALRGAFITNKKRWH